MNRLAQYMLQLATLMGSETQVHFQGLKKGSTVLCVRVAPEEILQVNQRLALVHANDAPDDLVRSFKALNDLLRTDNARATLKHGRAQIIKFPGCDAPTLQRIGPVKDYGELEGQLISVGGKDSTKHIRLLSHDGVAYKLGTTNIEMAKELGMHLFSQVRVSGIGTWYRNEDGSWELDSFNPQQCKRVEDVSLMQAIAALRNVDGDGWKKMPNPLATWHALRGN